MKTGRTAFVACMAVFALALFFFGCVPKKAAEGMVITDVTPTPEAAPEEQLPPLQSVAGLAIGDATLSGAVTRGLYAVPAGTDLAMLVNGKTDAAITLADTPGNLLVYACKLTLESERTVAIRAGVYRNGESLFFGTAQAKLTGAENSLSVQIMLPQSEAAEYTVELSLDGILVDRQSVRNGAIPLMTPSPTPEPTPQISLNHFPFLEKTVRLDMITDDPESEEGSVLKNYAEEHKAKGRFVVMVFRVVEDTLPLEQIDRFSNTIALTGGGDGYTSLGYNVFNIDWDADKQEFVWTEQQTGFRTIFDIPSALALADLQLELVNDVSVRLPIRDWSGFNGSGAPDSAPAGYAAADNSAAAAAVIAEESLDGMKPGVQTDDIRARLGGEDDLPLIEMETMQLFYMSTGYVFTYSNSTKIISAICAYAPAAGKTARGVGIGSDYSTVAAAYRGEMNAARTTPDAIVIGDDSAYLEFIFENGAVNLINLNY
ncbi:MAG: hypothetical protein VB062_07515 [Christensenella sp.]|nr:hypothetical protein [Christensenella sp.]